MSKEAEFIKEFKKHGIRKENELNDVRHKLSLKEEEIGNLRKSEDNFKSEANSRIISLQNQLVTRYYYYIFDRLRDQLLL